MPGKRMLDESICIDKRLNAISEGSENLFYRLLARTDDAGNVFAEPDLIKSQIYSRRPEIDLEEIKRRLTELHNAKNTGLGLIDLYANNGELYAHFPNWHKYQKLRADIKLKIQYPLHTRNNSLQTWNEPFTQVSKISKQVSKDVTDSIDLKKEIKKLQKLYPKDDTIITSLLMNMGFTEAEITEALKEK